MRLALLAGLLLAAACGGPGQGTVRASPSPSSAPTPLSSPSPAATPRPAGLLFAVLESSDLQHFPVNAGTVAIVGLDGYARAKQRFTPRTTPSQCNAASLPQPEARVANGRVYYAEGSGQVRSLDPTGAVQDVIAFPIDGQKLLSFAVDPTGGQVLASVVTIPRFVPPGLPCNQQGDYVVDLEYGSAGGHPQNVYHQAYAQFTDQSNFIQAVGWDPAGAIVTVHSTIGTQQGSLGQKWYGQLAHWTPQGISGVAGGSDCRAQDEVGNSIACISGQGEGAGSVRSPDGTVQWNLPSAIYYFILLSPDGTRAAYCNSSECGVAGKDGSHARLPAGFNPTGWLDASTLIGVNEQLSAYGEMETVSLSDLGKVDDLGFKGMFAGVVQAS